MKFIYSIIILCSIASCGALHPPFSNPANLYFIGNPESPTNNVDIYFSDTMVKKRYRIMGEAGLNSHVYLEAITVFLMIT